VGKIRTPEFPVDPFITSAHSALESQAEYIAIILNSRATATEYITVRKEYKEQENRKTGGKTAKNVMLTFYKTVCVLI